MGRFTIAAKHHQTIAEIYESDIADLDKAINHYEKSADYFRVGFYQGFRKQRLIFYDNRISLGSRNDERLPQAPHTLILLLNNRS